MLEDFDDVLQRKPGKAGLMNHAIHTDSACQYVFHLTVFLRLIEKL